MYNKPFTVKVSDTMTAKVPKPATLSKYGLRAEEWLAILDSQNGVCPICGNLSKRMVTDHDHVTGWKKMPPEERKKHVRGITCWWCNKNYIGRSITLDKARNVVRYLLKHKDKMESPE